MYEKRIDKIFKSLPVDALLITDGPEVYYLSGFRGDDTTLVITKNERFIITDSRYFIQAKNEAPSFTLVDITKERPYDILKKINVKKIGILEKSMSVSLFGLYSQKLSGCEFVPACDAIEKVRMIKDEGEISKIRTAAKIADRGFSYILNHIKAGVSEKELALMLEFFMRKEGAEELAFETVCASGVRSAMPHGAASDKLISDGDFLTLDFGCRFDGYVCDMTRTVVVGSASDKQREIYDIVLSAQLAALDAIFPGKSTKEIDKISRDYITQKGYGECFGHGLGHSLGLCVHEAPSLSPRSDAVLLPGMLMTVEPGIYVENYGGVRIEDLVVIKDDGYENLTSSKKELIIV